MPWRSPRNHPASRIRSKLLSWYHRRRASKRKRTKRQRRRRRSMATVLIEGPAKEPVTLIEAKLQLGMSQLQDTDMVNNRMLADLLRDLIATARALTENYISRALITSTWRYTRDNLPGSSLLYSNQGFREFYLPRPPFQ